MRLILQIIIICLLAANCFLFYTMTVSFDRARKANVILAGKLQTVSGAKTPAEKSRRSGDFANREYFSPDAVDGGELVTVISSDPPGLNPLLTNEKSASDIFALCSLTLAERDWKHREKYRPVLAESFSISPDNKSYRIKLRKGVKWQSFTDPDTGIFHPAKEITAHDIKFTVDTILDPGVNCAALRGYYSDISEVKIINDHEFIVSWKKEYYGSKASTLSLFPLPRHFYCPDRKFDAQKFNNAHSKNRILFFQSPKDVHTDAALREEGIDHKAVGTPDGVFFPQVKHYQLAVGDSATPYLFYGLIVMLAIQFQPFPHIRQIQKCR